MNAVVGIRAASSAVSLFNHDENPSCTYRVRETPQPCIEFRAARGDGRREAGGEEHLRDGEHRGGLSASLKTPLIGVRIIKTNTMDAHQ